MGHKEICTSTRVAQGPASSHSSQLHATARNARGSKKSKRNPIPLMSTMVTRTQASKHSTLEDKPEDHLRDCTYLSRPCDSCPGLVSFVRYSSICGTR